jgi:hypothetical protein
MKTTVVKVIGSNNKERRFPNRRVFEHCFRGRFGKRPSLFACLRT